MEGARAEEYVCPNCGAAARGASVCTNCGAALDAFRDLPTHAEYVAGGAEAVRAEYTRTLAENAGQPGSILNRFFAGVLDTVIILVVTVAVGLLLYAVLGEDVGYGAGGMTYLALLLFYAPVMLAFHDGQTWGKQACRVRVQNVSGDGVGLGRAFVRESLIKLFLGFTGLGTIVDGIVALARRDRRALHDLMIGTEVLSTEPSLSQQPAPSQVEG